MIKTETKVKWASVAAGAGAAAATYILEAIADQPVLVSPLPDWLEPLVVGAVPMVLAFLAGRRAPHTARPDLPQSER